MEPISVVIPTHERPAALRTCLAALAAQTLDLEQFEVVVVDDGGSVELGDIVDRHQGSLRISLKGPGFRLSMSPGPPLPIPGLGAPISVLSR